MKRRSPKFLVLPCLFTLLAVAAARGQGNVVNFSNLDPVHGVNAPFYDSDGTTRLSGANYAATLYFGPPGTAVENLLRAGQPQPFRTGNFAGYWVPANIPIPGPAPGGVILAQVRFWDTQGATLTTFEQAQAVGAKVGFSLVLQLVLSPSGSTPLTGLRSASLMPVLPPLSPGETRTLVDSMAVPNGLALDAICARPVGLTRWFQLTFARAGGAVIQTEASAIDTVLGVFTNCLLSPNQCVLVGCNDDQAPGQSLSEVRFQAQTNVTYAVVVGGGDGATGAVRIAFSLPTTLAISAIANQSINESSSTGPIPFTVAGLENSGSTLTVAGASSNPSLVPAANLVFGGSGTNRSVTVIPAPNQFGAATITVVASDPSAGAVSRAFVVTVNAVIRIVRGTNDATVSWTATNGLLQESGEIDGLWTDLLPEPTSPYRVSTPTTRFYRLRQR